MLPPPCDPCCETRNFLINLDFLYWYANESNLTYAEEVEAMKVSDSMGFTTGLSLFLNPSPITQTPVKYHHFDTRWTPGVRLGIGSVASETGWDLYLEGTYYTNDKHESKQVADFPFQQFLGTTNTDIRGTVAIVGPQSNPARGSNGLVNPWANPSFLYGLGYQSLGANSFEKISSKWELTLAQLDLELGWKWCFNDCFNLRTFAGVRGAWAETYFRNLSTASLAGVTAGLTQQLAFRFKDRFQNDFEGAGLVVGVQPNWQLGRFFTIFGDLDGALLWGKFDREKKERYLISQILTAGSTTLNFDNLSYSNKTKDDFFDMQPMLDLALGIQFAYSWCQDRYKFGLSAAWEQHVWFDHVKRTKLFGSSSLVDYSAFNLTPAAASEFITSQTSYQTASDEQHNLNFGGLVVRLNLEF